MTNENWWLRKHKALHQPRFSISWFVCGYWRTRKGGGGGGGGGGEWEGGGERGRLRAKATSYICTSTACVVFILVSLLYYTMARGMSIYTAVHVFFLTSPKQLCVYTDLPVRVAVAFSQRSLPQSNGSLPSPSPPPAEWCLYTLTLCSMETWLERKNTDGSKSMSVEYKVVDCMVRKSMYLEYKVMVPSIQENVRRIQSYGSKNSNLICMVYAVFNPQIQS